MALLPESYYIKNIQEGEGGRERAPGMGRQEVERAKGRGEGRERGMIE